MDSRKKCYSRWGNVGSISFNLKGLTEEVKIFFTSLSPEGLEETNLKYGFIDYPGFLEEEQREQIRYSLSFVLGDFLSYLGHKAYDEQDMECETYLCSALHSLLSFNSHYYPALIFSGGLTSEKLTFFIKTIIENFQTYELERMFLSFFQASYLMRASSQNSITTFRSLIEFICVKHKEINKKSSALIDKKKFKKIKDRASAVKEELLKVILEDEALESTSIVQDLQKDNWLENVAYLDKKFESYLENNLKIKLSKFDKIAIDFRNDDAHGQKVVCSEKDSKKLSILASSALRVVFVRALMGALNLNDFLYYDFMGKPKNLEEPSEIEWHEEPLHEDW